MSIITVSVSSRYKDTPVYDDGDEGFALGLFEPPAEFLEDVDGTRFHVIRPQDVGMLDILAVLYYGKGQEVLWWSIALANAMIDPEEEMIAGQTIKIPPRIQATSFVQRAGLNVG